MTSTRPDVRSPHTSGPRRTGPLTPVEMAQAAVMGALSAALSILSVVVPFAGPLSLLVTVPMGILGYRYRMRVLVAAAFAASTVSFLIAGISGFMVVLNCAYIGGITGIIKRRRGGIAMVLAASVVAGIALGLWIVGVLLVLNRLRTLIFDLTNQNPGQRGNAPCRLFSLPSALLTHFSWAPPNRVNHTHTHTTQCQSLQPHFHISNPVTNLQGSTQLQTTRENIYK